MNYQDELGNWEEIILEPSGDTLPIGAITQFGGETAPTNWLFCNGQAVSRETYAELFEAIGTTYGDGDGSTTFNVPDFIGRVPVGLDAEDTDFDTLGETGGSKDLQEHTHRSIWATNLASNDLNSHTYGGVGFAVNGNLTQGAVDYSTKSAGTGDSGNLQPYTVTNFIIKAKQSIGIVGTVSEDITDTNEDAVPNCETVKDYADKWKGTVLWTNQNPTVAFETQTITLASEDYDLATVLYASSVNEAEMSVTIRNGKQAYLNATQIATAGIRCMKRTMDFNGSSVTVSDVSSKVNTTTESTDNRRLVPLVIIGYKTGLFD